MDLEKLLHRIKAEDVDRRATLETLNHLSMGFVSNVPFETLDMFGGRTKIWNLERIYHMVVDEHRGGFCCDLNGLLQWILKQFGFKVDLLRAYACVQNEKYFETSGHMALMVSLENGEKWLTDVGFGGSCFALPLKMEIGLEQSQPNGVYRLGKMGGKITVEKKKQLYLKVKEDIIKFENEEQRSFVTESDGGKNKWNIQFGFSEVGYDFEDFQEGHDYAQFKSEFHTTNLCVVLQNERGRKFLMNNLFYEKEYVNPETIKLVRFKQCTLDEMYQILEKEFGLKIDYKLKLKKFV